MKQRPSQTVQTVQRKTKLNKKNAIHLCILIGVYLIFVLALTRFKYAYGSELDWGGQHYAIPDYFRKLFYKTGDFFPSFAPNIGGGENIYNLSYYGLYSPIILFSYLLPFVKMSTYIQIVSVIGVIASVVIFYIWMKGKFTDNAAFALSIVFLFSAPLIFHSHRHIMFVNYMPFLLLGFIAIEGYFEGRKKSLVTFWAFMMILTSYFFAVSGLAAMAVYGVYRWLRITEKPTFKQFVKDGAGFAARLILAALMACVLILPTLSCMLSGRDKGTSDISLTSFIPGVNLKFLLYYHYSMGLCLFTVMSIVSAFFSKLRCRRFLGITMAVIATCPIIVYLLNGTLYIDAKVLIPFLPLGMLLFGHTYFDIIRDKLRLKPLMILTTIVAIAGLLYFNTTKKIEIYVIADFIVLMSCLFAYKKWKKEYLINIGMSLCLVVSTVLVNFGDQLVPLSELEKDGGKDINALADYIAEQDDTVRTSNFVDEVNTVNMIYNADYYTNTIYSSLHNKSYNHFYFNEIYNENAYRNPALTTQSHNIISNMYFSNRYLITDDDSNALTGYSKIKESGSLSLFENKNVLPLGYATDNVMSLEEYKGLSYPYSVEALFNNIIVEGDREKTFSSDIERIKSIQFKESDRITRKGGKYTIDSDKVIKQQIALPETLTQDRLMFISFKVNNDIAGGKKDAWVKINGDKNKLTAPGWKYYNNNRTFEYVLTPRQGYSTDYLTVEFSAGKYEITNVRCYMVDRSELISDVDPLQIDKSKTGGDVIVGSIDVTNDGYFTMSIPYAEGFKAYVDGSEVEVEKTDTAFIGFKISKGEHEIKIVYTAPRLRLGIGLSGVGVVVFVIVLGVDLLKKRRANKQ